MAAIAHSRILICPLCQEPLQDPDAQGKRLQCSRNHSFDLARQGYLHLLPVQHKRSRAPGDDKAMVASRKLFLNGGYYDPLAKRVGEMLMNALPADQQPKILDAGCGEGYYTGYLAAYLQQHAPASNAELNAEPNAEIVGIDISKPAILSACQRSKQIVWLVASLKQIPLQANSLDGILSVFSPVLDEPFQHCLKPDGVLIQVTAGNRHLQELKALLYEDVQPFDENKFIAQREARWELIAREKLDYRIRLNSGDMINALLAMTPHSWRIAPAKKARLETLTELDCEADFLITLWRPGAAATTPDFTAEPPTEPPTELTTDTE